MVITFDSIKEDIEAFADDIGEVVVDRITCKVLFVRNGKDYEFKILKEEGNIKNIEFEGTIIPYSQFLSKNIANLDLLAERLIAKRQGVEAFINSPASLDSMNEEKRVHGKSLDLIMSECSDTNPFNSKVVFITADAGHGKTALLRQFQHEQAKKYQKGESNYLFWHIDLQGRQLLRLSEALMGDLGELRIPSLWMQSLVRLMKHGKLVIGIDGFDELAAEQGSNDALGALALLLNQLGNNGTLIAASRRTFFNTEDYLKRTKLIEGKVENFCVFNQINLDDWGKEQSEEYLFHRGITNYEEVYTEAFNLLGKQENHPILCRPFLLSQLANGIINYKLTPEEFIGGMSNAHDPNKGVNSIIEALVKREVSDKWKTKDTGESYLNENQHMQLLSACAEEMWRAQTEKLNLEIIQTITVLLLDDWKIEDKNRRLQIFEMVRMHALLVSPIDGDSNSRSFEHPEFKDYFTALSLENLIKSSLKTGSFSQLNNFLSVAQISDSLALYTFANTKLTNGDVQNILNMFEKLVSKEWRPTFLQTNIGTLIPYLIKDYDLEPKIIFNSKVIYSSLIFENKNYNNTGIYHGNFLNTSFVGAKFNNVDFVNCQMNEVCFDSDADLSSVKFIDCTFNGLKIYRNEDEIYVEYSPEYIQQYFIKLGAHIIDSTVEVDAEIVSVKEHSLDKVVFRLLRAMQRTTFISKNNIETRLRSDKREIYDVIIPLMTKYGILEERADKGDVWVLRASYQELSKSKTEEGNTVFHQFWNEIHKL